MSPRLLLGAALLLGCPVAGPDDPAPDAPCDAIHPGATVGLRRCAPRSAPGATLFAPNGSRTTWLLDPLGRVLNSWESSWLPGMAASLDEDGVLLRAGRGGQGVQQRLGGLPGAGGVVERWSWGGALLSSWIVADDTSLAHHDLHPLPNGNVLVMVWEEVDEASLRALGRDPGAIPPGGVLMDALLELDRDSGAVVWRWATREHLVQDRDPDLPNFGDPAASPGRIDVNAGSLDLFDWTHFNGIDHDPDTDLIVVSANGLSELWVIDHAVQDTEGPEGDLRWRWGRPENWGAAGARELYRQHDPSWVADDRILVFDNGLGRPGGGVTRLLEVEMPLQGGAPAPLSATSPIAPAWEWSEDGFFVALMGGVQALDNGHLLVSDSPGGLVFELDGDERVWDYINPDIGERVLEQGEVPDVGANAFFFARHRSPAQLAGLELIPGPLLVETP